MPHRNNVNTIHVCTQHTDYGYRIYFVRRRRNMCILRDRMSFGCSTKMVGYGRIRQFIEFSQLEHEAGMAPRAHWTSHTRIWWALANGDKSLQTTSYWQFTSRLCERAFLLSTYVEMLMLASVDGSFVSWRTSEAHILWSRSGCRYPVCRDQSLCNVCACTRKEGILLGALWIHLV